jgi:hypothetical protein
MIRPTGPRSASSTAGASDDLCRSRQLGPVEICDLRGASLSRRVLALGGGFCGADFRHPHDRRRAVCFIHALFVPNMALAVRRLHDTGRSGWWLLLMLVPFVGPLVLLYWYVQPSEDGPNHFG